MVLCIQGKEQEAKAIAKRILDAEESNRRSAEQQVCEQSKA